MGNTLLSALPSLLQATFFAPHPIHVIPENFAFDFSRMPSRQPIQKNISAIWNETRFKILYL